MSGCTPLVASTRLRSRARPAGRWTRGAGGMGSGGMGQLGSPLTSPEPDTRQLPCRRRVPSPCCCTWPPETQAPPRRRCPRRGCPSRRPPRRRARQGAAGAAGLRRLLGLHGHRPRWGGPCPLLQPAACRGRRRQSRCLCAAAWMIPLRAPRCALMRRGWAGDGVGWRGGLLGRSRGQVERGQQQAALDCVDRTQSPQRCLLIVALSRVAASSGTCAPAAAATMPQAGNQRGRAWVQACMVSDLLFGHNEPPQPTFFFLAYHPPLLPALLTGGASSTLRKTPTSCSMRAPLSPGRPKTPYVVVKQGEFTFGSCVGLWKKGGARLSSTSTRARSLWPAP